MNLPPTTRRICQKHGFQYKAVKNQEGTEILYFMTKMTMKNSNINTNCPCQDPDFIPLLVDENGKDIAPKIEDLGSTDYITESENYGNVNSTIIRQKYSFCCPSGSFMMPNPDQNNHMNFRQAGLKEKLASMLTNSDFSCTSDSYCLNLILKDEHSFSSAMQTIPFWQTKTGNHQKIYWLEEDQLQFDQEVIEAICVSDICSSSQEVESELEQCSLTPTLLCSKTVTQCEKMVIRPNISSF